MLEKWRKTPKISEKNPLFHLQYLSNGLTKGNLKSMLNKITEQKEGKIRYSLKVLEPRLEIQHHKVVSFYYKQDRQSNRFLNFTNPFSFHVNWYPASHTRILCNKFLQSTAAQSALGCWWDIPPVYPTLLRQRTVQKINKWAN